MTFPSGRSQIRHDHSHRPITLGADERVFDGVGGLAFDIGRMRPTKHGVHVTLHPTAK